MLSQEPRRICLRVQPGLRKRDMCIINRFTEPAGQAEVSCLNREFVALAIVERSELARVVQIGEYRIAFVDLALANQPERFGTARDPFTQTTVDLGFECEAIELCDVTALVKRNIDFVESRQIIAAHEFQCIPVAQVAPRF